MIQATHPPLDVIILAAGKGTRMVSDRPKVLHRLAGRPLVEHVAITAQALNPRVLHIVYGYGGERVPEALGHLGATWVRQGQQKGTGHAVQQALPGIADESVVLVLYGDVPLTRVHTLQPLVSAARNNELAVLTMTLEDPTGYGRILRNAQGDVHAIVEQKDATAEQRKVREINTGILAASARHLKKWLAALGNDNVQGEYYLTDIIAMAVTDGVTIHTSQPAAAWEILGVNSKAQLAELERVAQRNAAQELMERGVTLLDPLRFDLRGQLEAGRDVVIDINVLIEGRVQLGDRVHIGPNNVLRDCRVAADTIIQPNCVIEQSSIGADCRIGPYARIRPESTLNDRVHIGNFVEIKKSALGEGSKANHLSYIGDSHVGQEVNIGAGTITANYDGVNKHRTIIGDHASIGADCTLVAPVTVGAGATVGANTTITSDVPPGVLVVGRMKQKIIEGWQRPKKKDK